jgi:hypothetical protein
MLIAICVVLCLLCAAYSAWGFQGETWTALALVIVGFEGGRMASTGDDFWIEMEKELHGKNETQNDH